MWKLSWLAVVAAALSLSEAASAKRFDPPKEVAPVTAKGVVYRVPHFGGLGGKRQNGGFVQAWDAKTRSLLWDRMVYRIVYQRGETDVQDVFITKIRVIRGKLLVTNEAGERFEMDLPSGRVRALTPLNERWRFGRRELPEPEANPVTGGTSAAVEQGVGPDGRSPTAPARRSTP